MAATGIKRPKNEIGKIKNKLYVQKMFGTIVRRVNDIIGVSIYIDYIYLNKHKQTNSIKKIENHKNRKYDFWFK